LLIKVTLLVLTAKEKAIRSEALRSLVDATAARVSSAGERAAFFTADTALAA